jgi:S4 domain
MRWQLCHRLSGLWSQNRSGSEANCGKKGRPYSRCLWYAKAITIAEFQGPVRPAIVAVAALPDVFEKAEDALLVSSPTPVNTIATPQLVVASAPIIETNASVKLVQVAAVANRKVRVLSSFLYYWALFGHWSPMLKPDYSANRLRLDEALVNLGHYKSRSRARDAIVRGTILVDGLTILRPSQLVSSVNVIELDDPARDT